MLPLSLLFGASFLCLTDLLARVMLAPAKIPIGVLTAFFGAPFFLVVLQLAAGLGDDLGFTTHGRTGGEPSSRRDRSCGVRAAVGHGIGPNGAGKSTLLRSLAGLVRFEGRIILDGHDSRMLRQRERSRQVALVPQYPTVPEGITATDYVLLGRTPPRPPRGGRRPRPLRCPSRP